MKKHAYLLALIFILTFSARLFFSFQSEYFANDGAYLHLRLIESIKDSKNFITYDTLSYGGRDVVKPQLFHSIMALFSFIPNYSKIIPELFISFIPIIVYLIAAELTKDKTAALITAFMSSLIPIVFKVTLNQVSPYSLAIPVILLMVYSLIRINETKFLVLFVILSFLLPWINPSSFLFMLSLLFYIVIIVSESMDLSGIKKEAITFSFFTMFLLNLVIFRKVLLQYGASSINQNIPQKIFEYYFSNFSLSESLFIIGIIPLVLGIFGIYLGLHNSKNRDDIILLSSPIAAALVLLMLKMIDLSTGILFLGIFLALTSALSIREILNYFSVTKLSAHYPIFVALFVFLILGVGIFSSLYYYESDVERYDIDDLKYLAENSDPNAVILSAFNEGNIVSYFSKRKNFVDSDFLLAPNPVQRLNEAEVVYKTFSESKALEIMKRNNVKYILLSENTKETYDIDKLLYVDDRSCFEHERESVYKIVC
ncbi:hypothetical protein HYT57_03650 [Candidatus Woesearchaeota archaeon]|nr:hypothetical protein [Candidatus Woesearchaeota archaeon]